MPVLKLEKVKAGMIVAKAVVIEERVVLAKGAEINEKILSRLKTWGCKEIEIIGDNKVKKTEPLSSKVQEDINNLIDFRFKFSNPQNKIMAEIKRIAFEKELNNLNQANTEAEKED